MSTTKNQAGSSGKRTSVREDRKTLFRDAQQQQQQGPRSAAAANSTAHEARSIQQSLQRTQNLLKNELNRVSQVASAIDEDGRMLEDTKTTHQSLNVKGAKQALTSLQRAQQQEQQVLMASVLFFLAVVFYIMWQRILIKLPFVERILKIILGKTNELFGQSLHAIGGVLGEAMTQVQTHIGPALNSAKELSGEAWQIAEEKGKEFYEKVRELLPEKD